jgi:carboxylate-amine ligase
VPRAFRGYSDWVATVDALLRSEAIADPSLLWWDARLQPRHGTVEIRIMDGQTTVEDVAALAALVQSLARCELERLGGSSQEPPPATELIEESRFLAARDGMEALLIDVDSGQRIRAGVQLERILAACRGHAERLGCERELAGLRALAANGGAARQLAHGRHCDLRRVAAGLGRAYSPGLPMAIDRGMKPPARRAA